MYFSTAASWRVCGVVVVFFGGVWNFRTHIHNAASRHWRMLHWSMLFPRSRVFSLFSFPFGITVTKRPSCSVSRVCSKPKTGMQRTDRATGMAGSIFALPKPEPPQWEPSGWEQGAEDPCIPLSLLLPRGTAFLYPQGAAGLLFLVVVSGSQVKVAPMRGGPLGFRLWCGPFALLLSLNQSQTLSNQIGRFSLGLWVMMSTFPSPFPAELPLPIPFPTRTLFSEALERW